MHKTNPHACCSACGCVQHASMTTYNAALQQIYGLCKQHGIRCACLRLQLMQSFACSHLLFACTVWEHAFGTKLQLRTPVQSSCRKRSTLHTAALHWSIRVPSHTKLSVLYLLSNSLPLHGLITKQHLRYFHSLQHSTTTAEHVADSGLQHHSPRWAATLLSAAIKSSRPCDISSHCVEGLLALRAQY